MDTNKLKLVSLLSVSFQQTQLKISNTNAADKYSCWLHCTCANQSCGRSEYNWPHNASPLHQATSAIEEVDICSYVHATVMAKMDVTMCHNLRGSDSTSIQYEFNTDFEITGRTSLFA